MKKMQKLMALMMALMMSFAQLILKKSSLWAHGLLFCMYYEFVLLWQMPWAWITFWVSDWGTRSNKKKKEKLFMLLKLLKKISAELLEEVEKLQLQQMCLRRIY